MELPLKFTATFSELYHDLPQRDVAAVDRTLDELEVSHDQPHMRGIVRVGEHTLFVTPRIGAPEGLYRVTWSYDDREHPRAIVCITVARVET